MNSLGAEEDGETLARLCEAASAELVARLREGVEPENIKPLFVTAAGVLALSMYIALGDRGETGFKAGDVSLNFGAKAQSAHTLRTQAETILAAYLRDRGFEFKAMEG